MAPRVLVVDDDPDVLEMVGEICRERGFEVTVAHDGIEALKSLLCCTGDQFDLVLLDLTMPRMTGTQLLEIKNLIPEIAAVPVYLITGAAPIPKVGGARLVIGKPFNLNDLSRILSMFRK